MLLSMKLPSFPLTLPNFLFRLQESIDLARSMSTYSAITPNDTEAIANFVHSLGRSKSPYPAAIASVAVDEFYVLFVYTILFGESPTVRVPVVLAIVT